MTEQNNEPDEVTRETVTERAEVPNHEDKREELRTPDPQVVQETVTETVTEGNDDPEEDPVDDGDGSGDESDNS